MTIGGFCVVVYLSISSFQKSPAIYKEQLYSLKTGDNASTVVNAFVTNPIEKQIDHMYLRFHKEYSAVQKGQYLVDGKKSLLDILKDMVAGNVVEKIYPTFTVVEGANLSKILNNISKRKVDDKKFYSLIKDHKKFMEDVFSEHPDLLEFIGGPKDNFEGLVAPATYPMYEKSPLYNLFKRGMINQVKILKKEWENRDPNDFIKTPYEALILASLIERETFLDEERSKVSSVFKNRLQNQMRLQTDPAVMYGVSSNFTGKLTKKHLKADTPYNTYTRAGLPPTPICMPQEKSIHAALHPEDSKALYFVAKGVSPKEGHSFSSTLDEHNKAVQSYRKKVSDYLKQQQIADSSQDELIEAENEAQNNNSGVNNKADTTSEKSKSDDTKDNAVNKNSVANKDSSDTTKESLKKATNSKTDSQRKTDSQSKAPTKSSEKSDKTNTKKTSVSDNNSQKDKIAKSKTNAEIKKTNQQEKSTQQEKSSSTVKKTEANKEKSSEKSVKAETQSLKSTKTQAKTDESKEDRLARIRQIQKDAFKKETPVQVETKKDEIVIKVD
ncbi:MAG: endolytic transglycosylase MltG [Succinivibrio sp.]|nr:endolytic transglycosylase MltG [Succinivibrio sp.]